MIEVITYFIALGALLALSFTLVLRLFSNDDKPK